jgi:glycine/D-amino acid oxidase-like deaminating enzyme
MPAGGDDAWVERVRPQLALHAEAGRVWPTLEAELGAELGIRIGGGLLVGETLGDREQLIRKLEVENAAGIGTRLVEGAELRELGPFLDERVTAASYHPGEGHANSLLVAPAFARAAVARGVSLLTRAEVVGIEPRSGGGFEVRTTRGSLAAGRVVDAAGAWVDEVAAMVGLRIPIVRHVVTVNVTEPAQAAMGGMLVQHVSRGLTLKQAPRGNFIVGGGWPAVVDERTGRRVPPFASIVGNLTVAAQIVPRLLELRLLRSWAGIGGDSGDFMPIIGESERVPGFHVLEVSFGFTLGPVGARLLAERMVGGSTSLSIDPFSPNRF